MFADKIVDAQNMLDSIEAAQKRHDGAFSQFTTAEKEVALLLTEGKTRSEILTKLRITAADLSNLTKSVRDKISEQGGSNPVIDAVVSKYALTKREGDMLYYLNLDFGNEKIASELFLSEETVRIHVRNVLKKISVENRKDVSKWLDQYANAT